MVVSSNVAADQVARFAMTNTKLNVRFVNLSTQNNAKLLQQLKSGFKHIIIWNRYQ